MRHGSLLGCVSYLLQQRSTRMCIINTVIQNVGHMSNGKEGCIVTGCYFCYFCMFIWNTEHVFAEFTQRLPVNVCVCVRV